MMEPIYVDTLVHHITDRISAHIMRKSWHVRRAYGGFDKAEQLPPDYQRAFLDGVVYLASPYAKVRDAGWFSNVVELLEQSGDLQAIRSKCQNNVLHSVYGMAKLMELLNEKDLFPEPPPQGGEGMPEVSEGTPQSDDDSSEGAKPTADFIENGSGNGMSGEERMEMRSDAQDMADVMKNAIDDISDLTDAFGMSPYGAPIEGQSSEDYPEDLVDAAIGNKQMQHFIRAIGRAVQGFEAVRHGPPVSPPMEPAMGDNLDMLQSHEYLMLSVAKRDFLHRYSEQRLDVVKQQSVGNERGPFVCAVDRSESMDWGEGRMFTAIILGTAATLLAHRDGRRVRFMTFNSRITKTADFGPIDSKAKVFAELLAIASHTRPSGGTDIEGVQDAAMDFKEETDDQGDLLLVTDGACYFRERTDEDPRYFLVNIGTYSATALDDMCENSIRVRELNKDSEHLVISSMAEAISC